MRFVLFYHTVHVMELVHVQRHAVLRLGDHTTSHLGQVNTINIVIEFVITPPENDFTVFYSVIYWSKTIIFRDIFNVPPSTPIIF